MENLKYKFIVAGAGVSGLTTAYELSKTYPGEVLVLEKDPEVGGLCKTVSANDALYDLGSHRIHWHPRKKAFELIKELTDGGVTKNARGGKLRIRNSYINYPITSVQMFFGIGLIESFLCAVSLLKSKIYYKFVDKNTNLKDLNYESYIIRKAGHRAYKLFYEPYARKVWGCEPSLISDSAVKKRISMIKPTQFLNYIIANLLKKNRTNYYYYFDNGIGTIPEALQKRLIDNDCKIITNIDDFSIKLEDGKRKILFSNKENEFSVEFETLISTIPIDELILKLQPEDNIRQIVDKVQWRGLKLVYMHIKGQPEIKGETFYFPELRYIFGRVSIPKRFSAKMQPDADYTAFVCEVPCGLNDNVWNKTDKQMYDLCLEDLQTAHLISKKQDYLLEKNFIISIPKVYPIYIFGWKEVVSSLMEYLTENFPYIYTSGKPGFFMHCNLDHSIDIGLLLAKYITEGKSAKQWCDKINFFHNLKLRD